MVIDVKVKLLQTSQQFNWSDGILYGSAMNMDMYTINDVKNKEKYNDFINVTKIPFNRFIRPRPKLCARTHVQNVSLLAHTTHGPPVIMRMTKSLWSTIV